jgi:PKD repeat protein
MKKIFLLFGLTIFMVTGCRKINQDNIVPSAYFSVSPTSAETSQNVYFTNQSSDADSYSWDFGDGYTSKEGNPVHYYTSEGTYTTTLTAYRNNGNSDSYQIDIDVYNTVLEVTVAEYNANFYLDNVIPDAAVTLYLNYGDWYARTNAVETEYTNSSGVAVFPQLQPIVYYVDVNSSNYNNSGLGQESGHSFIETLALVKAQINTFTAWVDYVGTKEATTIGTRIKSGIEPRTYKLVKPSK